VKKPLRIAFLTPEFVRTGGLSSYVYRMSKALMDMGHEPEIFTPGNAKKQPIEFEGIRVYYTRKSNSLPFRLANRIRLARYLRTKRSLKYLRFAAGMSRAVEQREKEKPFDFVHSSDVGNPGFFVRKLPHRSLIVRCSWARDLWLETCGTIGNFDTQMESYLERMLIQRSNVAYAPSKFIADYYSKRYGMKLEILRPAFLLDAKPSEDLPWKLPHRFFFHFGTLGPIKGTDVLAEALPLVWREEPSFAMVWAGHGYLWTKHGFEFQPDAFARFSRFWGKHASQVKWLGQIAKPKLYGVLKRAEAAVLPSRCDNLPNTAIECLSLGIPVIGSRGASFDELIEPGFSGELTPIGDPVALAKVMLKVWRREVAWTGRGFRPPAILKEMVPHVAATNLIRMAGFVD
jgi:glycosyltransferase involved in cell wall biosynthesis